MDLWGSDVIYSFDLPSFLCGWLYCRPTFAFLAHHSTLLSGGSRFHIAAIASPGDRILGLGGGVSFGGGDLAGAGEDDLDEDDLDFICANVHLERDMVETGRRRRRRKISSQQES